MPDRHFFVFAATQSVKQEWLDILQWKMVCFFVLCVFSSYLEIFTRLFFRAKTYLNMRILMLGEDSFAARILNRENVNQTGNEWANHLFPVS